MMGTGVALLLAAVAATMIDRMAARRGLDPPGFRDDLGRRLYAGLGLALILFLGIFYPAVTFDQHREVSFDGVSPGQLFFFPIMLLSWLAVWLVLGFVASAPVKGHSGGGLGGVGSGYRMLRAGSTQLGLRARHVGTELSIGLMAGLIGWLAVLAAVLLLGVVVAGIGGKSALATEPAEQIIWLASLPIGLRLVVSMAAGVVEELFFRGFLQPRVGIGASTVLFVAAHLAYGQLFMLFGISLLSFFYAGLTVWRRGIWAAMAAHFLFDAVQLVVVIPAVLRVYDQGLVSGL